MGSTLPLLCSASPTPSPQESDWSDEDWNVYRLGRKREERKKEQLQKEEEEKNEEKQVPKDYFPPSPVYDPTNKVDALPHCDPKMKQALDPNHYPPNYTPMQKENTPTIVGNLVPMPVKIQKKKTREKTRRRTAEGTQWREKTRKKTRHRQTWDRK